MAVRLSLAGSRDARTLTTGTLSIGRGERNDWVLPDPDRHLSKTHCVLSIEDGRWVLTDLSTNGVHVNGASQPTTRDSRIVLTDGDQFRIGDHRFTVDEAAAGHFPPPGHHTTQGDDPLDIDPLDDPLSMPIGRTPDPAFNHPVRHAAPSHRTDDPFERHNEGHGRPQNNHSLADDSLFGSPAPGWSGSTPPDHADAPRHAMPIPQVLPPVHPNDIDFDALIGDLSPPPRIPHAQAQSAAQSAVQSAAQSPVAATVVPPVRAPGPLAPPQNASGDALAGLHAFLDGAGLPGTRIGDDPEAALRAIGQVFRVMTEGLRDVLMSRTAIKNDLRVDQTMIKASGNNALKFSMTADDAVLALLSPGRQGYMPPLAAAREAFDDIKSHELAVMAGVQTALAGLLRRFDPAALESRLIRGMLAGVVPATHKARLWDSFRDTYATIACEAEDDFQAVFGRAFAKAYMEQVQRGSSR